MPRTILVAEPEKQEIFLTRTFDAPRELVFHAITDPDLIPSWWGPGRLITTVDCMEVRKGGLWRFRQKDVDGSEYAFNGVYHEVAAPGRLVYTFEYEGMPGHTLLETITLEEQDGRTTITDQSVFQSVADRDGMLLSGMQDGALETFNRLAELLVRV
jgi:uncharacterized protein YndB with AHSA1/START domain